MKISLKKLIEKLARYQIQLGFLFLTISIILFLVPSLPQLWYRVFPQSIKSEVENIQYVVNQTNEANKTNELKKELPKFDSTLPKTDYIIIQTIGVKSPLQRGNDFETVLKHGSWMVNDFPTPSENLKPVIIASHRFGYITWSAKERKEISFYNLPKLKVGDFIEIIWNQRKYKYKIVKSTEGIKITDYDVDLILYTCKLYNSPVRIFKYAVRAD